jgi:arginase family enzyme
MPATCRCSDAIRRETGPDLRRGRQVLDRGAVPFLLGGDDSLPIPMLEAFGAHRGKRLTILQIDAHIDWRDEVGGERLGLSSTMRRASEMGHVERIIQVGQRGIGSARRRMWRMRWTGACGSCRRARWRALASARRSI